MLNGSTFNSTTYPALYSLLGTNQLPDMRCAVLSGKGAALPAGMNVDTNPASANYDSGALGEVVGDNMHDVPVHSHTLKYNNAGGTATQIFMRLNGGTSSGSTVGAENASGNPIQTYATLDASGYPVGKTYTDVRGKRLLCNFIIRAIP